MWWLFTLSSYAKLWRSNRLLILDRSYYDMKSRRDSYDSSTDTQATNAGGDQQQRMMFGGRRRMRTSFKAEELKIMKSYFLMNKNPTRKDLESLSEKTGLEIRVLQVSNIILTCWLQLYCYILHRWVSVTFSSCKWKTVLYEHGYFY